ncbi:MAG: hypothetical protein JSV33_10425 [bacterium]|nr:MAG: hypothetical protein JSV33_10425 [bacterium]
MKKALLILPLLVLLTHPPAAHTQSFGQFTTAAVASEGEGGFFLLAGEEAIRAGVMARFLVTGRSDIGFQIGYDRECGENSIGAGVDFKYYPISSSSDFPVDLAAGLSFGHFRSGSYNRNQLGLTIMASGILRAETNVPIEPYASLMLLTTYFVKRPSCGEERGQCWPCSEDDWDSDTDTVIRAGVNVSITHEYQVFTEISLNDTVLFGAGFNVIF